MTRKMGRVRTNKKLMSFARDIELPEEVDIRQISKERIWEDWTDYCKAKEDGEMKQPFDADHLATAREYNAEKIRNGDWEPTLDNYGRLHYPLTSLWSPIRKHLRYKGEPLVSIDVRASQPQFFVSLILAELTNFRYILQHTINHNPSSNSPYYDGSFFDDGCIKMDVNPCLSKTYDDLLTPCYEDVIEFVELVVNPLYYIYDELAILADCSENKKGKKKADVFKLLYGTNRERTSYQVALDKHFPHIAEFIREYKRVNGWRVIKKKKEKDKEKGYAVLAQDMQRAESHWMYDVACKRILRDHPEIAIFPLHDAIYCTPENVKTVERVMYQTFFQSMGIRPQLSVGE